MTEGANDLTPRAITKVLGEKVLLLYTHRERVLRSKLPLNTFIRYYAEAEDPSREEIELLERMEELRREDPGRLVDLIEEAAALAAPKKEKKETVAYAPFVELSDGRLCEQAFDGREVFYVVYDPRADSVERLSEAEDGGVIYRPWNTREVKEIVKLPSGVEEYEDDAELFDKVHDFLRKYHYSPHAWEKALDAHYVLHTYIYDLLPITAYRKITGPHGSGKSTWLKVMGSICYRSVAASAANSEASLLRLIDRWRGTLLIDESDFGNTSLYSTLVKALNVGFDRDLGYITKCDKDDPSHIEVYNVYGPKLASTREAFQDDALESRFITTQPVKQPFARFIGPIFREEADRLRRKLLLWRFRNYAKIKTRVALLEDPEIHSKVFGSRSVDPRVAQIVLPLYVLSDSNELRETLTGVAEVLSLSAEGEEESLARQVISLLASGEVKPLEVTTVTKVTKMQGSYTVFRLSDIVEKIDPEIDPSEKPALARQIAKILRTRGCVVKRGTRGWRLVYVPESLLNVTCATIVTAPQPAMAGDPVNPDINTLPAGSSDSKKDPPFDVIHHAFVLPPTIGPASKHEDNPVEETAEDSNLDAKTANPASAPQAEVAEKPNEPKTEQAKAVNGLEEARRRLEELVAQLPPDIKAFLADYGIDEGGYWNLKCRCGCNLHTPDNFESHVRFGKCEARRCTCGLSWNTLLKLQEHMARVGCSIDPNPPPPDPPDKKTKRHWRRLHRNGDYFEVESNE